MAGNWWEDDALYVAPAGQPPAAPAWWDKPDAFAVHKPVEEDGVLSFLGNKVEAGFETGKAFFAPLIPSPQMDDATARGLGFADAAAADRTQTAQLVAEQRRRGEAAQPFRPSADAGMQEIQSAEGWADTAGAIIRNPLAVGGVAAESVGMAAPVMAAGLGTGPLAPLLVGAGSGSLEYGASMQETMAERGVDLTDATAVRRALEDPELMADARERAAKRGVAIGTFDALTAGLAGRLLATARGTGSAVARTGGELGMQAGGGMAGEAVAQFATDGGITSEADVLLEGFAELPTAATEIPNNYRTAREAFLTRESAAAADRARSNAIDAGMSAQDEHERILFDFEARREERAAAVARGELEEGAAVADGALDEARTRRALNPIAAPQQRADSAPAAPAPAATPPAPEIAPQAPSVAPVVQGAPAAAQAGPLPTVAPAPTPEALSTQVDTATTALLEGAVREEVPAAAAPTTLDLAANEAATSPLNDKPEPTKAQKESGNYAKGHAKVAGLDIAIENPKGSQRDPAWPPLANHYGYIKGTVGKDKDHIDVFLTDAAEDTSRPVFVVDQRNKDGSFDEHKVILGATTREEAQQAYLSNYSPGWQGMGEVTEMSQAQFKSWLKNSKATKRPAANAVLLPDPADPTTTMRREVEFEEETELTKRLRSSLERKVANSPLAGAIGQLRQVRLKPATQAKVDLLSKVLGRPIVLFRGDSDAALNFHGASAGGNLFINVDTTRNDEHGVSVMSVIGHEFLHSLRQSNATVYRALFDTAIPRLRVNSKKFQKLAALYDGVAESDALYEEALADYIGDLLNDEAYWESLAQSDPDMFESLVTEIIEFLRRIAARAKRLGAADMFDEAEQLREQATQILHKYMAETVEPTAETQAAPESATDDIALSVAEAEQEVPGWLKELHAQAADGVELGTFQKASVEEAIAAGKLPPLPSKAAPEPAPKPEKKVAAKADPVELPTATKREFAGKAREALERGDFMSAVQRSDAITEDFSITVPADTPELQAFAKGADSYVAPLIDGKRHLRVFFHGNSRNLTTLRGKQGSAIFLSPSNKFASPYAAFSRQWLADHGSSKIILDGEDIGDTVDTFTKNPGAIGDDVADYVRIEVYKHLLRNKGDLDLALETSEHMVENLPSFDVEEAMDTLRQIVDDVREDPSRMEVAEDPTAADMNIMPLFASVKNPWDYENPYDVKRVMEELRADESSMLLFQTTEADTKFPFHFTNFNSVESALRRGEWNVIEHALPDLLKEMGYDSYFVSELGVKNLAVFDAKAIKSASGNTGIYGTRRPSAEEAASLGMTEQEAATAQDEGDIRLSLNSAIKRALSRDWDSPTVEVERALVDEFRDLRELQGKIAFNLLGVNDPNALPDDMNAWRLENLGHGAFVDTKNRMRIKYLEPVMRVLARADASLDEFSDFLWWRHAPERDAFMRSKADPNKPPVAADGYAGISPAEAQASIAALDPRKRAMFERAAKFIDGLRKDTLARLLQTGQISQEVHDFLLQQYQHYVPMRGMAGGHQDPFLSALGGGQRGLGMSRNPLGKRATGRGSKPSNIIEEMIRDAEDAMVGTQKQRVLQALVRLIAAHPDPTIWEVKPTTHKRKWVNGVLTIVETSGDAKNQITLMYMGKPVQIEIRLPELRRALLNMYEPPSKLLRRIATVTRLLASVKTSLSPYFLLLNPVRDVQVAMIGIEGEHGKRARKAMTEFYPRAFRALGIDKKHKHAMPSDPMLAQLVQYAREFSAVGGKTGYTYVQDIAANQSELSRMLDSIKEAKGRDLKLRLRKAWIAMSDTVEAINDVAENATRLAVFAAMRETGLSVEQAAAYAKEVTVNFNRKGYLSRHLGAGYMFFNAATQGSVRMAKLMRNRKVQKILAGLTLASYVVALSQMVAAGDDDDGESLYEKAGGDTAARRSIPIYLGDGRSFNIPMGYGPNIFSYLGYRMAKVHYDLMRDKPVDKSTVLTDIISQVSSSMTPIDISGDAGGYALLPELLRIPVQAAANINDFGGRISARLDPFDRTDHAKWVESDPKTWWGFTQTARLLNFVGGGDAYDGAALDAMNLTGEQVRYIFSQFGGGPARLVEESIELFDNMLAGIPTDASDIPLSNVYLRGRSESERQAGPYYDNRDHYENIVSDWKAAMERGDEDKQREILADDAWVVGAETDASTTAGKQAQSGSLMETTRGIDRAIKKLRDERNAVLVNEEMSRRDQKLELVRIDNEIAELQKSFNRSFNEARGVQPRSGM